MLNLLPESEKREIRFQKALRTSLGFSILVIIFFVFFTLFLWGFKFYLDSRVSIEKEKLAAETKKFQSLPELKNFQKIIEFANREFLEFHNFYQSQPNITEALKEISETCPESIYFTMLSFDNISKQKGEVFGKVSLSGYAKTREDLFSFKKALEKRKGIYEVDVVPRSWQEPRNVSFALNLKIKLQI
ncbi:hypothetical protein J7J81_00810 [bacterium]|nr:hypothetical protein [bacterium]